MEVRFPDWKILFGESRTPLSARVTDFGLDAVAGNGNRKQGGTGWLLLYTQIHPHSILCIYNIMLCFMTYSAYYIYICFIFLSDRPI